MTRAEYEAKYGQAPTPPPTPVVQMTRAQYEAKYGQPTPQAETYGASFPASSGYAPSEVAKAVGNLPSSFVNLGKNIVSAVAHPIDTAKGIFNTAEAIGNRVADNTIGRVFPSLKGRNSADSEQTFKVLTDSLKQRYWNPSKSFDSNLQNLKNNVVNDPAGFGADILSILQGGAALTGKTAELNNLLSKTAQVVTKPVGTAVSKIGSGISKTATYATSQATGLEPSTLKSITNNPSAFTKAEQAGTNRASLGQEVKNAIDTTLADLQDTGSAYEPIRNSGAAVKLPKNFIQNELAKHGLSIDDTGSVVADTTSVTRNSGDLNAIQNIVDHWHGRDTLRADEFLNLRSDLADLAKYDAAKTPASATVARDLRGSLNESARGQLPGLQKLDSEYSMQAEQYKAIKRDYIDTHTGDLKDGAASKIANLTGKGKDQVLGRLEAILPGVSHKINILKAVEDIERASGLKVATYARAGVAVSGLMTGNVPVIVGAILAQPEIAVPLIRGYGLSKQALAPVLTALRSEVGALNNFTVGAGTTKYLKDHPLGMSIRNIANGDKKTASATKGAWPTTASKPSTVKNTSTGNAPTGKGGVSAPKADTSGPFEGGSTGTKLYHATDSDTFDPADFSPSKAAKGERYFNPLGRGMYLSSNKDFVRRFGKNTNEFTLPADAKIKTVTLKTWSEREYPTIVKQTLKKLEIDYWKDTTLQQKVDLDKLGHDAPITSLNEAEEYIRALMGRKFKPNQVKDAMEEVVSARNAGYDAIRYKVTDYATEADEWLIPEGKTTIFSKPSPSIPKELEPFSTKLTPKQIEAYKKGTPTEQKQTLKWLKLKYEIESTQTGKEDAF